jgi:hypothetical protein
MAERIFCKDCKFLADHHPDNEWNVCLHENAETSMYNPVSGTHVHHDLAFRRNVKMDCEDWAHA